MRIDKCQGSNKRFAPWIILCILSLCAAMIFVLPSMVFAEITGDLSQDCDVALIGTEHTITATVTEDGVPGASVSVFFFSTDDDNYGKYFSLASFDENGVATFSYVADSDWQIEITLYYVAPDFKWVALDAVTTTWTYNEADLCSNSQSVLVGGRTILNAKKKGALKIAICAADGLDVNNVDLETVQLAGVAPWHKKFKDSRLCPNGKDGVGDLVLKFKNREVVEALEESLGELEDGQEVGLTFTGKLNDGKALEGEWLAVIKKKGGHKHHGPKEKSKEKEVKEGKKDKK